MVLFPAAKKGTLVRMRHQHVRTQHSLHLLRMLHKREGGTHLTISISRITETPHQVLGLVPSQAT